MTEKKSSPAFQFYPNDWLGSPNIMLMTPVEEGAYIRLLAIAWNSKDCGLPDDDNQLAILSRLGEHWFNGSGTNVKRMFNKRGDRLFNERLLQERKKQEERRKKCSEAGIQSGKSRNIKDISHEQTLNERSTDVEQTLNSSFTSSSSISLKNIHSIFDHWNDQKIIQHKKVKGFKSSINSKLEDHTLEDIKEAISNYKKVLTSDEYYFTHRWTLKHFLQRGFENFLTINDPFSNYKSQTKGKNETVSRGTNVKSDLEKAFKGRTD